MKMFNKPNWVKPEINEPKYWLHLGIIAFIILGILQLWKGGQMLTLNNWLVSIPLIGVGDFFAHTILKLD
jgi:hypothetical protein